MRLYDVTLRDGNHALRHSLTASFISKYCKIAENSNSWAVEVGHGNGLGASSYLVGKSSESDLDLLIAAREELSSKLLAVHAIPGFATIKRDLAPAVEIGVDIFRIATHISEANTAEKHIEYLSNRNINTHGVLMMSHMADIQTLITQAKLMVSYGAQAIVIMDSAGHFTPLDVAERIEALKNSISVEVGFHAHNNLGVAISNATTAINTGAEIIDGASMGLGAGAGNAQLENIVAVGNRIGLLNCNLESFLPLSKLVEESYASNLPRTSSSSIQSGMAGVFSGYAPQVKALSKEFGLPDELLWGEIGKRKLVAGQESMIREIAQDLMNL